MFLDESNVGGRRVQRLVVVRNDELADFVQDIGPAVVVPQFNIIGGFEDGGKYYIEETVGRMLTIANQERSRDYNEVSIPVTNILESYANQKG